MAIEFYHNGNLFLPFICLFIYLFYFVFSYFFYFYFHFLNFCHGNSFSQSNGDADGVECIQGVKCMWVHFTVEGHGLLWQAVSIGSGDVAGW